MPLCWVSNRRSGRLGARNAHLSMTTAGVWLAMAGDWQGNEVRGEVCRPRKKISRVREQRTQALMGWK